jgi:hypothetical protein
MVGGPQRSLPERRLVASQVPVRPNETVERNATIPSRVPPVQILDRAVPVLAGQPLVDGPFEGVAVSRGAADLLWVPPF